jgi:hypothetical protein
MSQPDHARPLALLLVSALVLTASTARAEDPLDPRSYDESDAPRQQVIVIVEAHDEDARLVPRDRRGNPRRVIRTVPGEDPPDGYTLVQRPMRALLVPGIVMLPAGYAIGAWTSFVDMIGHGSGWEYGFIPLVGPFIAAGSDTSDTARGFYIASALLQNVGLALTIAGAVTKEDRWVRAQEASEGPTLVIGLQPGGMSLTGSF